MQVNEGDAFPLQNIFYGSFLRRVTAAKFTITNKSQNYIVMYPCTFLSGHIKSWRFLTAYIPVCHIGYTLLHWHTHTHTPRHRNQQTNVDKVNQSERLCVLGSTGGGFYHFYFFVAAQRRVEAASGSHGSGSLTFHAPSDYLSLFWQPSKDVAALVESCSLTQSAAVTHLDMHNTTTATYANWVRTQWLITTPLHFALHSPTVPRAVPVWWKVVILIDLVLATLCSDLSDCSIFNRSETVLDSMS